jgi:hypothetical protein
MSSVPSDVYARQLLAKHYGYPLFVPEPDDGLPVSYRNKGASIGDVGIITPDGSFDFLFNICVPANDPVNCYGVPDGFERVPIDPGEISLLNNMHPPGSDVSSASVKRANISLECSQKENEYVHAADNYLPYNPFPPGFLISLQGSGLATNLLLALPRQQF